MSPEAARTRMQVCGLAMSSTALTRCESANPRWGRPGCEISDLNFSILISPGALGWESGRGGGNARAMFRISAQALRARVKHRWAQAGAVYPLGSTVASARAFGEAVEFTKPWKGTYEKFQTMLRQDCVRILGQLTVCGRLCVGFPASHGIARETRR